MTEAADSLLIADEFFRLPDDGRRYELVRGVLRCMAAAGGQHDILANRLDLRPQAFVAAHGLGEVRADEIGFRLVQHPDSVCALIPRHEGLSTCAPTGE